MMEIEEVDYTELIKVITEFHDAGVGVSVVADGQTTIYIDYDSYKKFLKICEEYGIGHGNNKMQ